METIVDRVDDVACSHRFRCLIALIPIPTPFELYLRRICTILFCLDLRAAHTVCEDWTREERLANIEPHFAELWVDPPPLDMIESWVESEQLYHSNEAMHLDGFNE